MRLPLLVPIPPPGYARLRFTNRSNGLLSQLIDWATFGSASHVEAVLSDGSIIAALMSEGVCHKPGDYDQVSTEQTFVDVLMPRSGRDRWLRYLLSRVGRPYDFEAVAGEALHINWRRRGGFICSMLQTLALREAFVFPHPLSIPAHEITPRDLLLVLSAMPGVTIFETEKGN